jgi:uncharacterized protein
LSDIGAFANPWGDVAAERWDALAKDRFYASSDWLRFCSGDARITTGAVYAEVDGEGVAGVPVTAMRSVVNPFYQWERVLADAGLPSLGPSGLLVGAHRGYQTHLLTGPGVARERAAAELLGRLEPLAGQAAAGGLVQVADEVPVVAMFLSTEDVIALRGAGVRALPLALQPDAWIPLPEGGWDAWLASLSSGQRTIVRRDMKKFAAAGYEVTHTTLGECHRSAARLLACTERRYGHDADVDELADSILQQAKALGDSARVLLAGRPGEEPIGYCLYYLWGDTIYLRAAGFDYERLSNGAEYFNLVYYLPVRLAIEAGKRWAHAGIEATEAKALRGARLRPLWMLDLSRPGVLDGCSERIRAYNSRMYSRWCGSSPAVAKAMDGELWARFC